MIDLPLGLWGPVVALIYGVIGYYSRNLYPFSSYAMYASCSERDDAAVPAFFVGGEEKRLIDYVDFHGIDPDEVTWGTYACAHQWMVHEAQRWVREHTVDAEVEGSVDVVWGFYVFRVDDEGSVFEHFESVVEGKARRR